MNTGINPVPASIEDARKVLEQADYIADRPLTIAVFLALSMRRPLFLEGEAGVGKTEVARALAKSLNRDLIRLQCYEGIDMAAAAFEWDYPRQLLSLRSAEAASKAKDAEIDLYQQRFLLRRPLLQALEGKQGQEPVLLIDELDRSDEPFEAFLLEFLGDFQISVPEYKTVTATSPPLVVITSNRTREVHDAIKRRCLYHWVAYPDPQREELILRCRVPEAPSELAQQIVAFVNRLRGFDMFKNPGVAETIDWAVAVLRLGKNELDAATIDDTLGALLKYQDDIHKVRAEGIENLLASS